MDDALSYLYSLPRFRVNTDLQITLDILAALDNPHQKIKSVHITGTNGKGSTSAFLSKILQEAGYRVGMYTSPYMVVFNERIRINETYISDEELSVLTQEIKEKIASLEITPTFWEFSTALMFLYFSRQHIDIAVLEGGLGAQFDSVTAVHPLVGIITQVSLDHQHILGETKEAIAKEKAHLIKTRISVITAEKDPAILQIFKERCLKKQAKLVVAQEVLTIRKKLVDVLSLPEFHLSGALTGIFTSGLRGEHQIDNACCALLAAKELTIKGFSISLEQMQKGIAQTIWPGRLQVLSQNPLFLIDGAHNEDGIAKLRSFLAQLPQKKILVVGLKEGKEPKMLFDTLLPLCSQVIVTQANHLPHPAEQLAEYVSTVPVHVCVEVTKALEKAFSLAHKEDMIIATGSLYLIGDILKIYQEKEE